MPVLNMHGKMWEVILRQERPLCRNQASPMRFDGGTFASESSWLGREDNRLVVYHRICGVHPFLPAGWNLLPQPKNG